MFTSLLLVLVPDTHHAAGFLVGSTMEQSVESRVTSGALNNKAAMAVTDGFGPGLLSTKLPYLVPQLLILLLLVHGVPSVHRAHIFPCFKSKPSVLGPSCSLSNSLPYQPVHPSQPENPNSRALVHTGLAA